MNRRLVTLAISLAIFLTLAKGQEQAQQGKKKKNEVTIQGCMGRMSGDYLLFQTDPGNSYVLEAGRKIKLERYMGQQVEVTGTEHPTLSTSTNFTRRRAGSPVTIVVESINTVARECSDN
jgi:hypothetical protein